MACGSVDVHHKSRAYLCVKGILIPPPLFFGPCFDNSLHSHRDSHNTLVSRLHLVQTIVDVNDGDASGTIWVYAVKGYHECPFKVNTGSILRIQEERRTWECNQSCQWLKKVEINSNNMFLFRDNQTF